MRRRPTVTRTRRLAPADYSSRRGEAPYRLRRQGAETMRGLLVLPRGYGVGVAAAMVWWVTVTTQATASSVPSLRASPPMAGGKRAESPSAW